MLNRIAAAYLVTTALTLAPALAQSSSHTANNTQDFVTKAAVGGMFEVESSQLALKKSQDKDIRDFAQKMIDDHTKANDKLKSLAKGETVPTSLDQQHQQMLTKLQGDNGSAFADQFKQMQVTAHQQTIELFQNYANNGSDQPIKQFAQQTLPTLKDHLQMAQAITIANNGSNATQQTAQNGAAATPNAGNRDYVTQQQNNVWRSSKMIGLGVYNEQNQKVGDINEILFDKEGKVSAVVIGVGGFLGLGERNVAVPYGDLQWSMTPANARTAGSNDNAGGTNNAAPGLGSPASPANPAPGLGGAPTGPATGNTGRTDVNTSQNTNPAYPDHAVLANASKDQLSKAPQFNYGSAPR